MNGSVRTGRVLGVPLRIHWTVPLLGLLFGYSLGSQTLPASVPEQSNATYTVAGMVGALLLMASLLIGRTRDRALGVVLGVGHGGQRLADLGDGAACPGGELVEGDQLPGRDQRLQRTYQPQGNGGSPGSGGSAT